MRSDYLIELLEAVGSARGPTLDGVAGDGGEPRRPTRPRVERPERRLPANGLHCRSMRQRRRMPEIAAAPPLPLSPLVLPCPNGIRSLLESAGGGGGSGRLPAVAGGGPTDDAAHPSSGEGRP